VYPLSIELRHDTNGRGLPSGGVASIHERKMERATRLEFVHTLHALPDLRAAGGRAGADGGSLSCTPKARPNIIWLWRGSAASDCRSPIIKVCGGH
jgi:hypothetical protein